MSHIDEVFPASIDAYTALYDLQVDDPEFAMNVESLANDVADSLESIANAHVDNKRVLDNTQRRQFFKEATNVRSHAVSIGTHLEAGEHRDAIVAAQTAQTTIGRLAENTHNVDKTSVGCNGLKRPYRKPRVRVENPRPDCPVTYDASMVFVADATLLSKKGDTDPMKTLLRARNAPESEFTKAGNFFRSAFGLNVNGIGVTTNAFELNPDVKYSELSTSATGNVTDVKVIRDTGIMVSYVIPAHTNGKNTSNPMYNVKCDADATQEGVMCKRPPLVSIGSLGRSIGKRPPLVPLARTNRGACNVDGTGGETGAHPTKMSYIVRALRTAWKTHGRTKKRPSRRRTRCFTRSRIGTYGQRDRNPRILTSTSSRQKVAVLVIGQYELSDGRVIAYRSLEPMIDDGCGTSRIACEVYDVAEPRRHGTAEGVWRVGTTTGTCGRQEVHIRIRNAVVFHRHANPREATTLLGVVERIGHTKTSSKHRTVEDGCSYSYSYSGSGSGSGSGLDHEDGGYWAPSGSCSSSESTECDDRQRRDGSHSRAAKSMVVYHTRKAKRPRQGGYRGTGDMPTGDMAVGGRYGRNWNRGWRRPRRRMRERFGRYRRPHIARNLIHAFGRLLNGFVPLRMNRRGRSTVNLNRRRGSLGMDASVWADNRVWTVPRAVRAFVPPSNHGNGQR